MPSTPGPGAPPWRRLFLIAALAALVAVSAVRTQPPADQAAALDRKILEVAKKNSEALANLTHLSDEIGPRLTGSANLKRANEWTAAKMKAYGLTSVRLEPWSMPEGWERGPASARVLDPDNGRTLALASAGWAPGTKGKVQADVIALKARDIKELAAFKGKLKGAIVLDGPPREMRPLEEALKPRGPLGFGPPKKGEWSFEQMMAERRARAEMLSKEGVVAVLHDAGKHLGLLFTVGGWRGEDRPSASNHTPTLFVAHDHYAMLYRLATRPAPARTRIEIEVTNRFIPGPVAVYNTVGEIRGSEKPDEFVVVGAHLDSWDLGQGTTDNGTGTTVVLEAARILARCGTPPRRTIRFVLFTGEEQGLHGSRAYVEKHKDTLGRTSCCIVHDTGQGKVIGVGGRPPVKAILEKELAGLKELGVTEFGGRDIGGSDHASFEAKGVPGFMLRQEMGEYLPFSLHTQADTLARANEANLIQGAQVMAVTAMRIANLDNLLPRGRE
ncbi:MAG: M20/M25/M40 family metallo-hydrolase [Gemmataceae bacterium]|nr:M20/M25/M40 family metallo-hydrolase [Gemmataceae bacterium]